MAYAVDDFTIDLARDIGEFSDIWPCIADLERPRDAGAYVFQCRDHLQAWCDTIGRRSGIEPLFIKVATRAGVPLLLLPLGLLSRRGMRFLAFLDSGVCDYNAPVVYGRAQAISPDEMRTIWSAMCRVLPPFDAAVLEKIAQSVGEYRNPLYALASDPCSQGGHWMSLEGAQSHWDLEEKRDALDSRRSRKRLAEKGEAQFSLAQDAAEIEQVFRIFLQQKSRRYQATIGHPGFDVPGQIDYYRLLLDGIAGGGAQLAYLHINGAVIATAWVLLAGSRLYYMMCAYDDEWRRYSPGRLLLEDLVAWCLAKGLSIFDFGLGDEPYKLRWAQTPLPLGRAIHPVTLRGRAYMLAAESRTELRAHLPDSVVKAIKGMRSAVTAGLRPLSGS